MIEYAWVLQHDALLHHVRRTACCMVLMAHDGELVTLLDQVRCILNWAERTLSDREALALTWVKEQLRHASLTESGCVEIVELFSSAEAKVRLGGLFVPALVTR